MGINHQEPIFLVVLNQVRNIMKQIKNNNQVEKHLPHTRQFLKSKSKSQVKLQEQQLLQPKLSHYSNKKWAQTLISHLLKMSDKFIIEFQPIKTK
jgi:hypothetical protein